MKKTEKNTEDWQRTISITKKTRELINAIQRGVYEATGEIIKTSLIVEQAVEYLDRSLQRKAKREAVQGDNNV